MAPRGHRHQGLAIEETAHFIVFRNQVRACHPAGSGRTTAAVVVHESIDLPLDPDRPTDCRRPLEGCPLWSMACRLGRRVAPVSTLQSGESRALQRSTWATFRRVSGATGPFPSRAGGMGAWNRDGLPQCESHKTRPGGFDGSFGGEGRSALPVKCSGRPCRLPGMNGSRCVRCSPEAARSRVLMSSVLSISFWPERDRSHRRSHCQER